MAVQMQGHVYLTNLEEQKAREFFRRHKQNVPDMEEGDSLSASSTCGSGYAQDT